MKRLNGYKMNLWLVGVVVAIVLGGARANAEIIMSEPTSVGPVINDAYDVQNSDFSRNGLQLYFAVWSRPDGFGSGDIYMAERETIDSPWQEPVNLGPNVNSPGGELEPSISGD
jgi:OOP family OmpA-OmpF porin